MRATSSTAYAVVAGLITGSLLLVRGEALLLAPIIVVLVLASAAVDDIAIARVQRRFTIVALVTLFASYTYDVSNAHIYFRAQLRHLLPHFASRFAERAELEQFSLALVLAEAFALGLVLGLAWLVTRYARPRLVGRPLLFWRCAYGAVIVCTLFALPFFALDGLTDTWARWGPVLLALGAIGTIGVLARPGRYLDAGSGFLLFLVIAVFVVLFARRVPQPENQVYYLYFDRYLFSEVLPAALPLAAIGIQIVVDACVRFAPARIVKVAVAAVALIIAVSLLPQIHETQRVTRHPLLGDPYHALQLLDELTRSHGRPGVVVYSGSKTRPLHWFYPNTFRAFALPLRQSFDRDVVGVPAGRLVKDNVYSSAAARVVLALNHRALTGYLVQLQDPETARRPDDDHTKWVGSVAYICPVLGQQTDGPTLPWKFARLRFDVYALS